MRNAEHGRYIAAVVAEAGSAHVVRGTGRLRHDATNRFRSFEACLDPSTLVAIQVLQVLQGLTAPNSHANQPK